MRDGTVFRESGAAHHPRTTRAKAYYDHYWLAGPQRTERYYRIDRPICKGRIA